jgi:hypothetical protein
MGVIAEIYPNRLNRVKATGLCLAVMFKTYIRHIPDTLVPETTDAEFAEFERQGYQEVGHLSVKFGLNDPAFDHLLDPSSLRTSEPVETKQV